MNYGRFKKKFKTESGVSFIELIAAVSVFTILMLAAVQIFKAVVDGQRNSVSAQNVQENMRYALEKISREIRMAQVAGSCACGGANRIFNINNGGQKLCFKNKDGQCATYYLENNRFKTTVGADTYFITPAKVEAGNLKFNVIDNPGASINVQPYVTMALEVKAIGQAIHEQKMKIQMTVSSRYYE